MTTDLLTFSVANDEPSRSVAGIGDAELLRRYLTCRDESAFDGLVQRFGPLVISTAARILRDRHAAEDVFQASFLVLARDAGRIRHPDHVAAWLHQVVVRISRKALRRRQRERSFTGILEPVGRERPWEDLQQQFLSQLLDEELARLPETYREPLILHFLEGKTAEETAQALGTSLGAIRGRLQRGIRELRLRFAGHGFEFLAIVAALLAQESIAGAAVSQELIRVTVVGGLAMTRGTHFTPECSPEAIHLSTKETTMFTLGKVASAALVLSSCTSLGFWMGASADERIPSQQEPSAISTVAESGQFEDPALTASLALAGNDGAGAETETPAGRAVLTLKYDDGKPDGKKSIAGTGQMIQFTLPDKSQKLRGLRIHCSRYGTPQPPSEDAEFTIVSADGADIVHTEMVPYAKFKRGESQWTAITFAEPVEVPEVFSVILQFNAAQTKGVYVSYDSSTEGQYSKTGLPGGESKPVTFGGDWMVQAMLTKPDTAGK